jgi:hypothetical protein
MTMRSMRIAVHTWGGDRQQSNGNHLFIMA